MNKDSEDLRTIEDDYYAFLNVPRTATNEQISNAYRQVSRIYHPDKHHEPEKKKQAEHLFNKTRRAYEVLSDPHQRAIYDSLGVRGLEIEGWEIIQRTKTPQEIREEFERLAREREERRLEQRTNPRGYVVVNIDATELFSTRNDELAKFLDIAISDVMGVNRFPRVEVTGMSFHQSIEAPITTKNTVSMSGDLLTRNGTGTGSVGVDLTTLVSDKLWVQCGISAGNGPRFSTKVFRRLSEYLLGTAMLLFEYTPSEITPKIETTLSYQLDSSLEGDLTFHCGKNKSSMSTSIHRNTKKSITTFTIFLGVPNSYIYLGYTRQFYEAEKAFKLKLGVRAGTFGYFLEYGAVKQVSQHSAVSACVIVGVPTGVMLKLKFIRANQSYSFPISLCEEIIPSPIFYATVAPLFLWVVVKKLVIEPIKHDQLMRNKEKQKQANKSRMAELQREARAAKELMKATFSRIRNEEEAKRGLVIVHATYGRSSAQSSYAAAAEGGMENPVDSEVIDVTVQLQVLVKDSKLFLHDTPKSQLLGFYDPCVGEKKDLFVQYLFHNVLHQVTVGDTEPLRLPKNSHRVNAT